MLSSNKKKIKLKSKPNNSIMKIDYKNTKEKLNLLILENNNLKFRIIELEKNINLINKNFKLNQKLKLADVN